MDLEALNKEYSEIKQKIEDFNKKISENIEKLKPLQLSKDDLNVELTEMEELDDYESARVVGRQIESINEQVKEIEKETLEIKSQIEEGKQKIDEKINSIQNDPGFQEAWAEAFGRHSKRIIKRKLIEKNDLEKDKTILEADKEKTLKQKSSLTEKHEKLSSLSKLLNENPKEKEDMKELIEKQKKLAELKKALKALENDKGGYTDPNKANSLLEEIHKIECEIDSLKEPLVDFAQKNGIELDGTTVRYLHSNLQFDNDNNITLNPKVKTSIEKANNKIAKLDSRISALDKKITILDESIQDYSKAANINLSEFEVDENIDEQVEEISETEQTPDEVHTTPPSSTSKLSEPAIPHNIPGNRSGTIFVDGNGQEVTSSTSENEVEQEVENEIEQNEEIPEEKVKWYQKIFNKFKDWKDRLFQKKLPERTIQESEPQNNNQPENNFEESSSKNDWLKAYKYDIVREAANRKSQKALQDAKTERLKNSKNKPKSNEHDI